MPHLRLQVPEEWLHNDFIEDTGFDARKLLDHLVDVVCDLEMEDATIEERRDVDGKPIEPKMTSLINRKNLKHALIPLSHSGVGGDRSKGFLHITFAAGNDTPGRTATVRRHAAEVIGNEIDTYVGALPGLGSVTVHVQDIDRDRGYTTTASRKKKRAQQES